MSDQNDSAAAPVESAAPELNESERAELERLRAAAARDSGPAASADDSSRTGRWRAPVATLLVLIFCLLAVFSVTGRWARDVVFDTDRYVETVSPLATDPAIQAAFSTKIADAALKAIDVPSVVDQGLQTLGAADFVPPKVAELLPLLEQPLTDGVDSFVRDQINKLATSDLFAQAWVEANRQAHTQLVNALNGGTGAVEITDGRVSVNMAAFIASVKTALENRGLRIASRIPDVQASFTIFQSADLAKAERAANLLNTLATWLPIVALIFLAAGIYVARNRRRAILGAGIGLIISMGIVLLGLWVGRFAYLNALPPDALPTDAATTLFDTLTRFLVSAAVAGLALGLVMALAAYLSGPSQIGRWVQRGIHRATDAIANPLGRQFPALAPVGDFLTKYLTYARMIVIGVAALVVFVWPHPTSRVIFVTALIALLVLFVVEVLARTHVSAVEPAADETPVESEAVA